MRAGTIRTTGQYELPKTKRIKAAGNKLHTWTLLGVDKGIARYRCLICDHYDKAKWPHTPEPKEPYCK